MACKANKSFQSSTTKTSLNNNLKKKNKNYLPITTSRIFKSVMPVLLPRPAKFMRPAIPFDIRVLRTRSMVSSLPPTAPWYFTCRSCQTITESHHNLLIRCLEFHNLTPQKWRSKNHPKLTPERIRVQMHYFNFHRKTKSWFNLKVSTYPCAGVSFHIPWRRS